MKLVFATQFGISIEIYTRFQNTKIQTRSSFQNYCKKKKNLCHIRNCSNITIPKFTFLSLVYLEECFAFLNASYCLSSAFKHRPHAILYEIVTDSVHFIGGVESVSKFQYVLLSIHHAFPTKTTVEYQLQHVYI